MTSYPNVKINLGLNVLRKRPDGFHDLETVFVPYLDIHDLLEINPAESFSVDIVKEGGIDWDPMKDLTVRAYNLLRDDFDLPPVSIYLEKHSPVGAGLGGGSADAAFTLKALNELFELGLDESVLAGYAARLGSDCAFFIYNRPMFGRGKGEILSDCPVNLDGYRLEVVVPEGISVSTADAYRGIVPQVPELSLENVLSMPVDRWKDCLVNDFEATVFARYPRLAEIKQDLYRRGAVYASMSGSGSALYGLWTK